MSAISLRALYGTNTMQNAVHCCAELDSERRESELCFNVFVGKNETTFAWVKPDACARGHVDAILARVQAEGFRVVSQQQFTLSSKQVGEFYKDLSGTHKLNQLVELMSSGPSLALLLQKDYAVRDLKVLLL